MRSRVSRLPNPVMFDPKRHAKQSRWQSLKSDPEFIPAMLKLTVWCAAVYVVSLWMPLG